MTRAFVLLRACLALAYCAGAAHAQAQTLTHTPSRNLAILIFDGVQIIDYTGPYEAFGHVYTGDQPTPLNIYTVSEHNQPVTTAMGMTVVPKYSIDVAPKPDILIVPGGDVSAVTNSPSLLAWVKAGAQDAEIVMSVCNGAFILSKVGLLDGLEATTTATLIERLKAAAPKTRVRSDVRFVDNGKIITAAGLSSGIDGSLHVIERLFGRGTAQMAALAMEYNWDPNSSYVRAALADKYLPNQFNIESVVESWVPQSRSGDTEHWLNEWSAISRAPASELLQHVEEAFSHAEYFPRVERIAWQKVSESASRIRAESHWEFRDATGTWWQGAVVIRPCAAQQGTYLISVSVLKAQGLTDPVTRHK
ncbi:MAG: DJ-1/PfpI family protein [Terriglobales bacterium]